MEEPLDLRKPSQPIRSARYFLDYLADGLEEVDSGKSPSIPQAVVSTLDGDLQRAAERAVANGLSLLEERFDWLAQGEPQGPLQAALIAVDPWTGEILAMVGGRDYGRSQFNRATRAQRQPGSAFKPVVAMAALARPEGQTETGPAFTLASVLDDEPFQVETPAGAWQPVNYDRDHHGSVTLREALERSLNVPFARLGMAVGLDTVVAVAHRMGIDSRLPAYPSLALGAAEVSPFELTRAFGVLAAEGYLAEPKAVLATPTRGARVFDPAETYLVTSALRGAVERGTGQGIRSSGFRGDVAAKSGTTNDYRDGWFVGYTPSIVVGVWVGFDLGKPLELPGAGVALPIFAEFLGDAVGENGQEGPWGSSGFSYPPGLEIVDVEVGSGRRAGWGCPGEPELFLAGTAPEESCGELRWNGRGWRSLLQRGGEEVGRILRRLLAGEGEGRN
jgi:membrane carboxypeptidase/penicillin-binding protein